MNCSNTISKFDILPKERGIIYNVKIPWGIKGLLRQGKEGRGDKGRGAPGWIKWEGGGGVSLWSGVWGLDCKLTKETVIKKPAWSSLQVIAKPNQSTYFCNKKKLFLFGFYSSLSKRIFMFVNIFTPWWVNTLLSIYQLIFLANFYIYWDKNIHNI